MTDASKMAEERDAYSVAEFCRRHNISRGKYYDLPPEDRPREMRIGTRVLITQEEAAAWRARMVAKTARQQADATRRMVTNDGLGADAG
jgi:hypothetical protein